MPSARFSFSCDTSADIEIIQFLNDYSPRERGIIIKKALKQYARSQGQDRLQVIEDTLSQVFREVVELRKSGVPSVPVSENSYEEPIEADDDEVEQIRMSSRALLRGR